MNRKLSIAAMLALATATFTGPALAQLSTNGDAGPGNVIDSEGPTGTQNFRPNSSTPDSATNSRARGGVRRTRQIAFSPADGDFDLLNPAGPQDVAVTLRNPGRSEAEFAFHREDRRVDYVRLQPGRTYNGMFGNIVDVSVSCLSPVGDSCSLDLDILNYDDDGQMPDNDINDIWTLQGFHGDIVDPPDSVDDCLWEWDTLWSSNAPRKIDLFIELTADEDLQVEIIDKNDTVVYQDTLQEGALPQFQVLQGVWDDITQIRYRGANSPVNPVCIDAEFHYDLIILQ